MSRDTVTRILRALADRAWPNFVWAEPCLSSARRLRYTDILKLCCAYVHKLLVPYSICYTLFLLSLGLLLLGSAWDGAIRYFD